MVSYLWDFGDGTFSALPGPLQHTYNLPGTYIVTLTVTDPATCVVTRVATETLTVNAATGTAGPDQTYCIPGQVQLQASGGVSYSWSPGKCIERD